jgi:YD repeat-containing protein
VGDPSTAPAYLRTITQIANGVTLRSYTLTHSYLGQILQRTATGAGGMAETDTFGYDSRGRLTSENNQVLIGGVTSTKTGTYQYDLSNNLQGGVGGWTYNSNNQLTAAPPMGGLPGATGLTYDSAGNLTAANGMGFTYDALEEMTQATGTLQGTVTYTYDVLGRRASKTASGVTTNFLYDGDDIIAEATGAGVGAAISASYVWGPGGLISGALLAGGVWSTQFVLPDDADDDRCTVDEGANVVTQQSASAYYQPYQNVTVGTWTPPISRGAYKDGETGLAYAGGGSYYAPATGSFIAPDGVGSSSGLDGDPEEDWIGNCGSYGSFLAKAGRKGWNGLKAMPQWQPGSKDRRQISGMLSAIPVLGQIKMGLEALSGHDAVGGTCLSGGERLLNGGLAMLPVAGKALGEAGSASVSSGLLGRVRGLFNKPLLIALGKTGAGAEDFALEMRAKSWWHFDDWAANPVSGFFKYMGKAYAQGGQVYFNLQGVDLELVRSATSGEAILAMGNRVTEWELWQIIHHPEWHGMVFFR